MSHHLFPADDDDAFSSCQEFLETSLEFRVSQKTPDVKIMKNHRVEFEQLTHEEFLNREADQCEFLFRNTLVVLERITQDKKGNHIDFRHFLEQASQVKHIPTRTPGNVKNAHSFFTDAHRQVGKVVMKLFLLFQGLYFKTEQGFS